MYFQFYYTLDAKQVLSTLASACMCCKSLVNNVKADWER